MSTSAGSLKSRRPDETPTPQSYPNQGPKLTDPADPLPAAPAYKAHGTRRWSQPPLPSNLGAGAGLRAALLGYLGEVEASIRSRLSGHPTPPRQSVPLSNSTAGITDGFSGSEVDCSSSSAASDGDALHLGPAAGETDWAGYEGESSARDNQDGYFGVGAQRLEASSSRHSTNLPRPHHDSELRYRGVGQGRAVDLNNAGQNDFSSTPPSSASGPSRPLAPMRSFSSQDALLSHLSWLREDILASLPPAVLAAPSSSREWLRGLPQRLMAVERGLWAEYAGRSSSSSRSRSGSVSSVTGAAGRGYALGHGAVESARLKVLEMVRSVLPDDEWEGWERLGWEETDLFPPTRQSLLSGTARQSARQSGASGNRDEQEEEEEEEEESKFLFPNRTPAAAQAIASRRRTIRSKSLGAAGQPGSWVTTQREGEMQDLDGLRLSPAMPKLQRMRTLPNLSPPGLDTLFAHREGVDNDDHRHLFASPVDYITAPTLDEAVALSDVEDETAPFLWTEQEKLGQGRSRPLQRKRMAGTLGPSVIEALQASQDGKQLIEYEDLPVEWRNNEHIITGYRFIPLHAATGPIPLIKSAFAWHNETINVQSHFIPTLYIIGVIPFMIHSTPLPDAHPLDTAVLVLYLIAAISCLFSSAEWHVLSGCASKKWMEWGACVDYVGISWLIAASFGTVVYNAFYCQPKAVVLYCATNAACGALGSYLPFQRWFNLRRMKPWRIAFFLLLNVAMFAPMLQLFWKYGWDKGLAFTSPFGSSVLAYLVGLLFYAFHFPECIWPGHFDYWFHSHQVWHAGIVIAIVLHYKAVFAIHDLRYDYSCAAKGAGEPVSIVVGTWLRGLFG